MVVRCRTGVNMRFKEFDISEAASDPKVLDAQRELKKLGYNLGKFGPNLDGLDGILGPWTLYAMLAHKKGIKPADAETPPVGTLNREIPDAKVRSFGIDPNKISGLGLQPDRKRRGLGLKFPVDANPGQPYKGSKHPGVDFPVPEGTPVYSPVNGVVEVATSHPAAGIYVNINTTDGGKQRFLHLSKVTVTPGQRIKAGDLIGLSGNTGRSTGPHLHWEVWTGNSYSTAINPLA